MLPAFSLLLAFNLTSAMRVLFTIAIVLVSLSRRDARETGAESVLSALMAGGAAVAFSRALHLLAAAGRRAARHGVPRTAGGAPRLHRRHQGAVALAIPLVWVLLGTAEGSTLVEDARLVPLLDPRRALRGLGARADPGDAGLAGCAAARARRAAVGRARCGRQGGATRVSLSTPARGRSSGAPSARSQPRRQSARRCGRSGWRDRACRAPLRARRRSARSG